jgi:hypothetical protein
MESSDELRSRDFVLSGRGGLLDVLPDRLMPGVWLPAEEQMLRKAVAAPAARDLTRKSDFRR